MIFITPMYTVEGLLRLNRGIFYVGEDIGDSPCTLQFDKEVL